MPVGSAARLQPVPGNVKEETLESVVTDFACQACGNYKVCLTARESWYVCRNCGYGFGIAPHPKKRLRRFTDGSESIAH